MTKTPDKPRSSPGNDQVSGIINRAIEAFRLVVPDWLPPHYSLYAAARQLGTTVTIDGLTEADFAELDEEELEELPDDLIIETAEGESARVYCADCRLLVWGDDKAATRKRLYEENKDC